MFDLWTFITRKLTLDEEFKAKSWKDIQKKIFTQEMAQMLSVEMKFPVNIPTNTDMILQNILGENNANLILGRNFILDKDSLIYAIVNDIDIAINKNQVTPQIIGLVLECGNERLFHKLQQYNKSKLTIYHYQKAVLGGNINLVKLIGKNLMFNEGQLEIALQTNNTEIIKWMLEELKIFNLTFPPHLTKYLILNNSSLLNELKIQWIPKLFHSALLSGSWDMIRLIESHFPDLHNKDLDCSLSKGANGNVSLLTDESTYVSEGKIYFSHTMNYAVQSENLEIMKYIHGLGYGITISNLLTCINQGNYEQFIYLMQFVQLKSYYLLYFSCVTINSNKRKFVKALNTEMFDECVNRKALKLHWEIVKNQIKLKEEGTTDPDFFFYNQLVDLNMDAMEVHNIERRRWRIFLGLDISSGISNIDYLFGSGTDIPDEWVQRVILLLGNLPKVRKLIETIGTEKLIENGIPDHSLMVTFFKNLINKNNSNNIID